MSERARLRVWWVGVAVGIVGAVSLWVIRPLRGPEAPFSSVVTDLPPPPGEPTIAPYPTPRVPCEGDPLPWARAAVARDGGSVRDAGVLAGVDGAAAGRWVAVDSPRGAILLVSDGGGCFSLTSLVHRSPEAAPGSSGGSGDPRHPCLGIDILGGTSGTECFAWERDRPVLALTSAVGRTERHEEDWRSGTWTAGVGEERRQGPLLAVAGPEAPARRMSLASGSIDVTATEVDGFVTARFVPTDLPSGLRVDLHDPRVGSGRERVGEAFVVTLPVRDCPLVAGGCAWALDATSGGEVVSLSLRRHPEGFAWPLATSARRPVTSLAR